MKYLVTVFVLMLSVGAFAQQKRTETAKPKQATSAETPAKAYFSLEKKTLDFGRIKMGTSKTLELNFTNTGTKTLVLIDVFVTCGCITVDYPREPFLPGKSGTIKITYNPTDEGPFNKTVTIYTNAENNKEVVQTEGIVTPK